MGDARYGLEDFELYRTARAFRVHVYAVLKQLPRVETYCLGVQMRRAAISVSNNIAEGHGRWHFKDNVRFCIIARGSVEELIDDLNICEDEAYADPTLLTQLRTEANELVHRINRYIAYLRRTNQGQDERP